MRWLQLSIRYECNQSLDVVILVIFYGVVLLCQGNSLLMIADHFPIVRP